MTPGSDWFASRALGVPFIGETSRPHDIVRELEDIRRWTASRRSLRTVSLSYISDGEREGMTRVIVPQDLLPRDEPGAVERARVDLLIPPNSSREATQPSSGELTARSEACVS